MVLTRDALGVAEDASPDQGWLPDATTAGLPDGDASAGTLDFDADSEAASSEPATEADPYADIPPDLVDRIRSETTAEQERVWQARVGDVHRIKNGEMKPLNRKVARLEAEASTTENWLRQNADRLGLTEGDLAILTNRKRDAGDGIVTRLDAGEQRFAQTVQHLDSQVEQRLTEYFGAAGQRSYDPQRDPVFLQKLNHAKSLAGQWVMQGEPNDHRYVTVQNALNAAHDHLRGLRGATVASPNGKPKPPPSSETRAAAKRSGPAAPARTGGTGRGMDVDRAYEQARATYPDDPNAQWKEAMRLQEQGG